MKEMQQNAKSERQSCHRIIIEIEKLMYEMNDLLTPGGQPFDINNATDVFNQILDIYLRLPHRLKPIFDHCKKIESKFLQALKTQNDILNSIGSNQNQIISQNPYSNSTQTQSVLNP